MPPPPDWLYWLSWEFWAEAAHAVLSGRAWAWYVANSEKIVSLATLIAGVFGIPLLYIRTLAADRQARTAEQGHITDRFTKAVEQLGSDKMTVRLGAIYALERISKDSRRDHWTIMETLTAFVREQAPWPPRQPIGNPFVQLQVGGGGDETKGENTPAEETEKGAEPLGAQIRPPTDIQAVLTVLGRRDERARKLDQAARRRLGLRNTDLRGADLFGAHLQGADLRRAGVLTELTQAQLDSTFGDDH